MTSRNSLREPVMSLTHPGLLSFVTSEQKAVLTVAEEKQTQTVAKTPQVEALVSAASEEEKPPPAPGSCSLLGLRTS
jgi:hypothetical protein